MNAKRFALAFPLFLFLLSACAPRAATPEKVVATVVVEGKSQTTTVEQPAGEAASPPQEYSAPPPLATAPAAPPAPLPIIPLPTGTPDAMYFQDYGMNPYVNAESDHLSTFALDVDTASYTIARNYINQGHIPPPEAVRVEEFVNYFDMDYPTPPDVAFAIYADGAPSPFEADAVILRVGIQGYRVPEYARKPAALTFVIDVSGSMARENRLGLVKQSLQLLVDRLRPDDSVAIVVYGSQARVVLPPTSGEDRTTILNAIYSLRTEGATNAEAGLQLGYQLAMQAYRPGAINRVILCSDGVANVGQTGPEAILSTVRGYVEEGVTLTTVGFGMGNFNDVLMEQLADNGDGNYAYVDTLDEARKLFVDDLTSTLQVIALDAKVQVDFNPDVVAYYRLMGYENRDIADQDFRNDSVDAGEIGAGHSVTALYSVVLRPGAEGRLATVQLRWQDPDTYQTTEINGNFNTWDLDASFEQAAPRYQLAVLTAQYAAMLRREPWAQETSPEMLLSHVYRVASLLRDDPEVSEFATLVSRASQIGAFR